MLETASWGRRLLAVLIDWFSSYAVVALAYGGVDEVAGDAAANLYIPLVWVLQSTILIWLMGGSFGHLLTRLRVSRTDGGRLDPLRALLRSVLVALVIPPLVFRPDGRGLHDMAAGSVIHDLQVAA